jgi:hypothetical protein
MQTPKHGFTTPDGFEAMLKSQLRNQTHPNKGFLVPNGYAASLKQTLLQIPYKRKSNRWQWLTTTAAAIVILAGAGLWFYEPNTANSASIDYTYVVLEEVSYYDLIDNPQLFEEIITEPTNNDNYEDYILFES